MRVLLVNHTSRVSGAELSLLDLATALPRWVEPTVACPPGDLLERAGALGLAVRAVPAAELSFRLRPAATARGIAGLARTAAATASAAGRLRADVVHANSVRAGLAAVAASWLGAPAPIVHVRDRLPAGPAARLTRRVVSRGSRAIVANSAFVAGQHRDGAAPVLVVHNGVRPQAFEPARGERRAVRGELGIADADPVLGVFGQLTPWKAQDDAIRTLELLRPRWPRARLLVVGEAVFDAPSTRFDNRGYAERLRRTVADRGLGAAVRLLGGRRDVSRLLQAVDVVLVPSWEEPFGRVVIEAMATALPVVATAVGGPAEVVSDGRDGILLPPRRPRLWAAALDGLLAEPARRAALGAAARRTVERRFTLERQVEAILGVYLAGRPDQRPAALAAPGLGPGLEERPLAAAARPSAGGRR